MCGLVGTAGNLAAKDEATMKRLLLMDFFRGQESTGIAALRMNGDVKLAKLASHPLDLFEMPKFKEALNGAQSSVFLGHNRAATRGAVNTYNAHPFECGHIVGAHNGTLKFSNYRQLEDKLGEMFAVDSQAIFAAIEQFGAEETVKMLEEGKDYQEGAWALTWINKNEGTINFLRNKHRPLWYAFTDDHSQIFWASEWQMIDASVKMSTTGYELYREKDTGHRFWPFDEDVLYKFKILDFINNEKKKRVKPSVKKLKGKEPLVAVSGGTGGANPFNRNGAASTQSHTATIPTTSNPSTTTSLSNSDSDEKRKGVQTTHITLIGDDELPLAGYISRSKFEEMAKNGCSFCYASLEYGDKGITILDRDNQILCTHCSPHSIGHRDDIRIYVSQQKLEALL